MDKSASTYLMNFTGENCNKYIDGNMVKSLLRQNTCLKSNFNVTVICTTQKKGMLTISSTRTLTQSTLQAALQEIAAVYESVSTIAVSSSSTHSITDSAGTTSATSEPIVTGRSWNLFMVLFCVVCSLFIFLLLTCFCFTM